MAKAVNSGKYGSMSDVVRKAILLLEMEERKVDLLRDELTAGEMSPMITAFDASDFLEQIHRNPNRLND
jgi:antitoxin ParD1/3/4